MKTKGGRTLTCTDMERLADKAEQGFDLTRWQPRRGRPPLQRKAAAHRASEPGYPMISSCRATERAAAEGKSISEVVRELLAGYAEGRELATPRRRRSH